MARSDSSRSRSSDSYSSSVEREEKRKKKREKDSRRRSRSRSNKKKGISPSRDRKNRSRKDSESRDRKKNKKKDASVDRKRNKSSRSKDRKKRSASKDKHSKKRDKSISKKKRDRSDSPKKKRGDRSTSQHKKKDKSSKARSPPKMASSKVSTATNNTTAAATAPAPAPALPVAELTEEQKKEIELKKQRERLAKMRLLKFAASDNSSDDDKPTPKQQQQNAVTPTAAVILPVVGPVVTTAPVGMISNAAAVPVTAPKVDVSGAEFPAYPTLPPLPSIVQITPSVLAVEQLLMIQNMQQQQQQQTNQMVGVTTAGHPFSGDATQMQQQLFMQEQMEVERRKPQEDVQSMILRHEMEYVEDLIRQKQMMEQKQEISEQEDPEVRAKRILYDSDGLEEFSDEEKDKEDGAAVKSNGNHVKINIENDAAAALKRKKFEELLSKGKDDQQDDFSNVFGGAGTNGSSSSAGNSSSNGFSFAAPMSLNKLGGSNSSSNIGSSSFGNGNQKKEDIKITSNPSSQKSTTDGFNPLKTQIPQQLTADEDSEEDELDAYCRMIDEQLESEKPTGRKTAQGSSAPIGTAGAAVKKAGVAADEMRMEAEEEEQDGPVNYITMEEIFGKKDEDAIDEESDYDENDEFSMMKKREKMELEAATAAGTSTTQDVPQNKSNDNDDDEEDDEHYKAFKEAMRKKKNELLKDHTGDLLMDDEQEIEEKSVSQMETDTGENKEDYLERLKREAQKKDLKPVEYKAADLEKFRKNFYIESKEITTMSEDDVKLMRENLGDIQVKGLNVPRPIKSWYQSGLSDKVLDVLIKKKKYEKPFPIQCQSLPVIMSGRDTIGIAETGSGKTLAYILPMIRHIADQRPHSEGDGPIGLILVPTRELATQIFLEARPFLKPYGFEIVAVYGGTGIQGQLSELKRGCEIVVCTPGRLFDVLTTSNGKITNLRRSTMVVIDEADRMFDLGFEPQIAKILATTRPDKQTVLFSATFPKNVELLARKLMKHKPVEIMVGARGQACTNIKQIIEIREEATRIYRLLELLGIYTEQGQVIIFVDKQIEVDQLYTQLRMQHYSPTVLHAGVDADDRTNNLLDFKKGIYRILIATSVSSRGIDVKNVVLVVNFRCPNHIEDYIHRIGRTGRAGNKGTAVTFLGPDEEKYSLDLIKVLKRSDQNVPIELLVMGNQFKEKLKSGEAKQYNNANMQGKGFNFDEDEIDSSNKAKFEQKKLLALKMGIEVEDQIDEDEIFKKKNLDDEKSKDKKSGKPELTFQQKLHIVLTQDEYKDIKEQMLSESSKIAVSMKNKGQSEDAIKKATEDIFRKGLETFKPTTKNVDIGKIEIAKMLQEFEKNNEEENNQNVAELTINDYPENVRKAITRRDFLERIYLQTGCTVLQRGMLVEMGKKVQPGFQKLYLRIEGDSRFKVTMAYKDIKAEAEERSIRMHERGQNQGTKFVMP